MGSTSLGARTTSAMAGAASAPGWIPEDDLLLKNAVEVSRRGLLSKVHSFLRLFESRHVAANGVSSFNLAVNYIG